MDSSNYDKYGRAPEIQISDDPIPPGTEVETPVANLSESLVPPPPVTESVQPEAPEVDETEERNGSDLRPDPSNPSVQNDSPDIRIAVDEPVESEPSTETFDNHGPNLMPSEVYISSRSVVWVVASPRLKKVLEIEIKGFPQRFEVTPGQKIALPPVEGRRLVLFHLRGGGGGNKKFLELTVPATVTVNPAPGLFGGLLPIDIR